jgi:hypothetical protein
LQTVAERGRLHVIRGIRETQRAERLNNGPPKSMIKLAVPNHCRFGTRSFLKVPVSARPSSTHNVAPLLANPSNIAKDTSLGSIAKGVYEGVKDHAEVREALRHFVRDWGEEGGEHPRTLRVVLDARGRSAGGEGGAFRSPELGLRNFATRFVPHRLSSLRFHIFYLSR